MERKAAELKRLELEEFEAKRLRELKELEDRKAAEFNRLKLEELRLERERESRERKKRADDEAERLRLEIEALNVNTVTRSARPRMSLIPLQAMNLDVEVLDLNKGQVDLTKELQEAENLRRLTQNIKRKAGGRRETVAEREEKMQKQREILLAKKKVEREQQLKDFKESEGIDFSQEGGDPAKDTGGFMKKRNSILDAKRASLIPK